MPEINQASNEFVSEELSSSDDVQRKVPKLSFDDGLLKSIDAQLSMRMNQGNLPTTLVSCKSEHTDKNTKMSFTTSTEEIK